MSLRDTLIKSLDASVAGSITVRNEAFFMLRFSIEYTFDGHQFIRHTGDIPQFSAATLAIPEGATSIFLKVEGLFIAHWSIVFTARFEKPVTKCYKVWGTMLSPQHEEVPC